MSTNLEAHEAEFLALGEWIVGQLHADEHAAINYSGESSQFVRCNGAKVRQIGTVEDASISLRLMAWGKTATAEFPSTGDAAADKAGAAESLRWLREQLPLLPEDPYIVLPENNGSSRAAHAGKILAPAEVPDALLAGAAGLDLTGIYAGGRVMRGLVDSSGQKHWFATDSFTFDYSLCHPSGKAVKAGYAGTSWDSAVYAANLGTARAQLGALARPVRKVTPGKYRVFLAPDATAELLGMFSWNGVSERSLRQSESALLKLREGTETFSPKFVLSEDFRSGLVPRFNDLGQLAPDRLTLIEGGKLTNALVSARTAKEYGIAGNGAAEHEGLRSPEMAAGDLQMRDALKELGTGLYLSNLHYLNWSDTPNARITGMTRHACFWVEGGELVAPIVDLRFDETLFSCLGEKLLRVTAERELIPNTSTYERRSLGGMTVPGLLIRDFTFTL